MKNGKMIIGLTLLVLALGAGFGSKTHADQFQVSDLDLALDRRGVLDVSVRTFFRPANEDWTRRIMGVIQIPDQRFGSKLELAMWSSIDSEFQMYGLPLEYSHSLVIEINSRRNTELLGRGISFVRFVDADTGNTVHIENITNGAELPIFTVAAGQGNPQLNPALVGVERIELQFVSYAVGSGEIVHTHEFRLDL